MDISLVGEVLWLLGGGLLVVTSLGIYGASKDKTWPLTAVRTTPPHSWISEFRNILKAFIKNDMCVYAQYVSDATSPCL